MEDDVFDFCLMLTNLADFKREINSSVALFEFSLKRYSSLPFHPSTKEDRRMFKDWMLIGAHSTVFGIFHFYDVVEIATKRHGNLKSYLLDPSFASDALASLEREFSFIKDLRNSVAHRGEKISKPEKEYSRAAISNDVVETPGGIPLFLSDTLTGSKLTMTHKGRIVTIEINNATLNKINIIFGKILQGARPTADLQ